MSFLGIELDSISMEARLPELKLKKCISWVQLALAKTKLKLRELWKLLGLLYFTCQVVVPGRAFLRRLHNLTIGLSNPHCHLSLGREGKRDLQAWNMFLTKFNGKSFYKYSPWVDSECLHLYTYSAGSVVLYLVQSVLWPMAT